MAEINTFYTFDKFLSYEEYVKRLLEENGSDFVFNDSAVHASIVMKCILRNSKEVNMYCGKFSIFRDGFKDKIDLILKDERYEEYRSSVDFQKFKPYDDAVEALIHFFKEGGRMDVVVDEDISSIARESIWGKISEYYYDKKLRFYKRDSATDQLSHFTVGDKKMFRFENSNINKTALCCFNDTKNSLAFVDCFNLIKRDSKEILLYTNIHAY
ncbi:MAG: hypothetical protein LBI82_03485 [Dysgonamonadaceae bacterium]|jgi:hypothetical protein|nr:hypothetical protein [Dysgonamonadaceae bacterium]